MRHTILCASAWALLLLVGCESETVQQTADLTVPVTVQPVGLGTIESVVTSTGTLRPIQEAVVVTETRGFLSLVQLGDGRKPTEGMAVQQGQVLARLDNEELMVGARLEARKLAVQNARQTLAEQEVLVKRGLVTQFDVEAARKDLADAQSDYDDALVQIGKTAIIAPIAGVLSEFTDASEQTLVEAGTSICRIVAYSKVLLDLQIPNSQIRHIALDQPVRAVDYSYPDEVFVGHISAVDPVVDAATRTFRAVATIDNPEHLLRPGMFVKAEIVVESHADAVPGAARVGASEEESQGGIRRRKRSGADAGDRDRARRRNIRGGAARRGGRGAIDYEQLRDPAVADAGQRDRGGRG